MTAPGLLFVVAAPSGAGKTSICKALLGRLETEGQKPLTWSCSYTTRSMREGEVDGRDYFFVDDEAFDRMVSAGEFAEWAEVHGRRYGTSKSYLERSRREGVDLLLEIDIQGARQLKEKYEKAAFIFIMPPSWEELVRRLKGRGTEDEGQIAKRLMRAREEILEYGWFDYIIINDEFDRAVEEVRAVVMCCRRGREVMDEVARPIVESSRQDSD